MVDKAQVEHYLNQKVNPLLEELLTSIINTRPKNIVTLIRFSFLFVGTGWKKNQIIFKCFPIYPTLTPIKMIIEQQNLSREKEQQDGISLEKGYVVRSMVVITYGMILKCQPSRENQQSAVEFSSDLNHFFCLKISMTKISIV